VPFLITDLGNYDIILGRKWLAYLDLWLDVRNRQLIWPSNLPPTPALTREILLFAILVGAVGERPLGDDSQAEQAFGDLLGHHRRAVIGQERTRQPAFLDRLGEAVHQILRRLGEVPLDVAAQSRVVIEDARARSAAATGRRE
jgi:hypothetical protein